jgi:hypothetical protein
LLLNWGGNDIAYGGPGNDELITLIRQDFIDFKFSTSYVGGKVTFYGEEGNDVLVGGEEDDLLYGGEGDDMIFGKAGNDKIFTGTGQDKVYAGEGDDVIFINSTGYINEIYGGPDNDTFIIELLALNQKILYCLVDFDLDNERIDLSRIPYVHSPDDFNYIDMTITIGAPLTDFKRGVLKHLEKGERTEDAFAICWRYTEESFHCVVLLGDNCSVENFIFN